MATMSIRDKALQAGMASVTSAFRLFADCRSIAFPRFSLLGNAIKRLVWRAYMARYLEHCLRSKFLFPVFFWSAATRAVIAHSPDFCMKPRHAASITTPRFYILMSADTSSAGSSRHEMKVRRYDDELARIAADGAIFRYVCCVE